MLVPGINGSESAAINKYGLGRNVAVLAGGPRYIFEKRGPRLEPVHDVFSDLFQIERGNAAATVSRASTLRATLSSPAKAGDPVFQRQQCVAEKPRVTGSPGRAGR